MTRYLGVDADVALDVGELEQSPPLMQCCGLVGTICSALRRGLCISTYRFARRCCCLCPRRRSAQQARAPLPGQRARHPDSEIDDEDQPLCKADCVALRPDGGEARALSQRACSDAARGEPTRLLVEDGAASATAELEAVGATWQAPLCRYHAMQYSAQRGSLKCALRDCYHCEAGEANGLQLCVQVYASLRPTARG